MKNLDFKKLLVLIIILAIVIGILLLIFKQVNKNSISNDEQTKIENAVLNYFTNITAGYNTTYGGIDALYLNDETTFEDLETISIINLATKYIKDNEIDSTVSSETLEKIASEGTYSNIDSYTAYTGTSIRQAIYNLFGQNITDKTYSGGYYYLYTYYYVIDYDVYLAKTNDIIDYTDSTQSIEYSIIETTKEDNKIMITIAVAYTYSTEDSKSYAKDSTGENIIVENATEFPTENIDEFDHFTFTLNINENGNYVFESIKKIN